MHVNLNELNFYQRILLYGLKAEKSLPVQKVLLHLGQNLSYCFHIYFYMSANLETSEKKSPIDANKISEELFPCL